YEGLVKPNSDGELICAVARDYEITNGGRTYTFFIREGVQFHNGQTVTAADVVYSIERCADASGGAPLVAAFSAIEEVKATDDITVEITIKAADLDFLSYLTEAIVPNGYDQLATAPMGTGPFKYVSRSPQENIVIEKFDGYWGEGAALNKVTYKIYEDSTALVMALKGGAIDLCAHLTSAQVAQLDEKYFQILEDTMKLVQAVYLNHQAKPFDDQKVREALCYAIDRQQIMDFVAGGRGTAVGSSMYPAFTKYFMPELVDYYKYDPAKAKQLLSDAGYNESNPLKLSYKYSNNSMHGDVATMLQSFWSKLGVEIDLVAVEQGVYYDQIDQGDFELCRYADSIGSNAIRLLKFWSTENQVVAAISDPVYDQMCADALKVADAAGFAQAMHGLEDYLIEENVYLIPLFEYVNPYLLADGVEGETLNGTHPFFGYCSVTK
ncbi:MAG: ABC transporter substrate-binding protein, partial [Clostridia bacterium]|nr:ABC transporter substrate-binding protein [Clostridia bacterium]